MQTDGAVRIGRMYRLDSAVYYEQYGEQVYVRNVSTQKDYLFSEITSDVLNCFSKTGPRPAEAALNRLLEEYVVEDEESFRTEILEFLDELAAERILVVSESAAGPGILEPEVVPVAPKPVGNANASKSVIGLDLSEVTAELVVSEPVVEPSVPEPVSGLNASKPMAGLDSLEPDNDPDAAERMDGPDASEPTAGFDMAIVDIVQGFCEEHRTLYRLMLELTYRCNEKCVHCYVDGPQPEGLELTLKEYKKLLYEAREAGCLRVQLTGGEVCMRPDWIEIAEYAASIGMLVDIYSNGIAITVPVFDRICALHPNSLSFSLYGSTRAAHDAITQVPGSFERTLKSVMMTKRAGIDTFIKTVVMKENAADLENLFRLGQRIHVPVAPALSIFDTYAGISRRCHMLDTVEEYRKVITMCLRYAPNVISRGRRDVNESACRAGHCSLAVDPYGNVKSCMSLPPVLGNVRKQSITEIWTQSEDLERIRCIRCVDLCAQSRECRYADFCHFCIARLQPETKTLPEDTCILAEASWMAAQERRQASARKAVG